MLIQWIQVTLVMTASLVFATLVVAENDGLDTWKSGKNHNRIIEIQNSTTFWI